MVEFSASNARYTYLHAQKYPYEVVDIHHIVLRSSAKYFFVYSSALLVLACSFYLYVLEEKSISLVYYSLLFDIFLVKLLFLKPVKKESVVIMPAFGVQLETHYARTCDHQLKCWSMSGRPCVLQLIVKKRLVNIRIE